MTPNPQPLRVGLAGLGTVGGEAARLIEKGKKEFARRLGRELRLEAVCDRNAAVEAKRLGLPRSVRSLKNPLDLLKDPALDVVIETLGGHDEARRLVLGALRSGKSVVTANKQLLAHHWDELVSASRQSGARLRFEASVAGGIPIVHALHQSLSAGRIRRVLGILNGTTNFILSRMAQEGVDLKSALLEAQRLGLAEKNPTFDLDGTDAAHKVSVLASLLAGRWVRSTGLARSGILGVTPEDMRFAASELKRTVRLLGMVDLDWESRPRGVTVSVAPVLVPLEHPLASVYGEYNAVMVETSEAGDLMFYGKGAGAGPAASAVVGDLFMLAQELGVARSARSGAAFDPLWAKGAAMRLRPIQDTVSSHYLRLKVLDRPGVLAKITGVLGRHGISIARIHQEAGEASKAREVSLFLTTHPAQQRLMERAVRETLGLSFVSRDHSWLRML